MSIGIGLIVSAVIIRCAIRALTAGFVAVASFVDKLSHVGLPESDQKIAQSIAKEYVTETESKQ